MKNKAPTADKHTVRTTARWEEWMVGITFLVILVSFALMYQTL